MVLSPRLGVLLQIQKNPMTSIGSSTTRKYANSGTPDSIKRIGDYCHAQLDLFEFDVPISDRWLLNEIAPAWNFAFARWLRFLACTNPKFVPFLLDQPTSYIHVTHYVFDGLRHRSDELGHKAAALTEDLMRTPQDALLRRFARPYAAELGPILEKLDGFFWEQAEYRQLAMLVLDESSRAVLSYTRSISRGLCNSLYALPEGLRWSPAFLNARLLICTEN